MWSLPARALALLLVAGAAGFGGNAQANPRNGTVAAGSATIATAPGRVDVNQTSDRLIVNWQGFSIGADELTRFNQPSSNAVALNRVTGGEPSQILGQLSANGKILLINPNGVLFGAGSRVDVAGLIATTANLRDDDFMAKRLNFAMASDASTASVVNRGTITVAEGGLVALVAPAVANEGVINARLGKVSLVAADRFTVDFHGDRLIQFALDDKVTRAVSAPDGALLGAAVTNSGRIAADGGIVQMSANVARGVLDKVIDMSGVVEARAARKVGGAVVLDGGDAGIVQVSGRIDASGRAAGQTGGTVRILGEHVGLFGGARIDAAGDAGGGTVLVGGNYQGQGAERRATATYVDTDAAINSDALRSGDGGKVVVWSDAYTRFDGAASARGGAAGGAGGLVETSSHQVLTIGRSARVDAAASAGKAGQWLLDPANLSITGATSNGSFSGGNPDVFTPSGNNATADVATINASLSGGSNVTVTTSGASAQPGNLTLVSPIVSTSATAVTLTLSADSTYTANADISSTSGPLNVVINSVGNHSGNGTITTRGGNVTIALGGSFGNYATGGDITTGGGNVSITAGATGGNYSTTGAISTGGGTLTLNAPAGNVTFGNVSVGTGTITASAQGAVNQSGGTTIAQSPGAGAVSITAGTTIGLDQTGNQIRGAVSLNNSGANTVTLRNTGGLTLGASSVGSGTLTISATGPVTQTGAFQTAPGSAATITAGANPITLTNTGNTFRTVALSNSGSNAVSVTSSAALTINTSTVGSDLTLTADTLATPGTVTTGGGTLTVQPLTASTTVRFGGASGLPGLNFTDAQRAQYSGFTGYVAGSTTGTGPVLLFGPETFANTNLTLRSGGSGGSVSMNGNALTMIGSGSVTLSAGGAVNTAAIITASGAVSITAGGTATINAPIQTAGGTIGITGAIALPGPTMLNTVQSGATGAAISLAGAISGAGQALTLNAGSAGDISLQSAGSGGALGAITVQNARNVTGSGAISAASFTQSAGTGTTNFGGAGLTTSGAATLTTASIAGTYTVGSFTVTSGQTIATGTIAGVGGLAAAALASAPGSTGTQTFNGCTIATTCTTPSTTTTSSTVATIGALTTTNASAALLAAQQTATRTSLQILGVLGQSAPSDDSDRSNVQGFEVTIPMQNVDWTDPGAELRIQLAPDYQEIQRFFGAGEASSRATLGGRSGR